MHYPIRNKFVSFIVVSIAIACALSALFSAGFLSNIQARLGDSVYDEKPGLKDIIIVKIDDRSLQQIGRWPWDRDIYVDALEAMKDAAVVGMDISFFETSGKDEELSDAIMKAGNVVLPVELSDDGFLLPVFAADYGHINAITDSDGVTRSFPPALEIYDSFAVKIAEKYLDKNINFDEKRLLINFIGIDKFESVSFIDIEDEDFTDKIILIGATAPDLHDDVISPFGRIPGVEMHASIIQMILLEDYIKYQDAGSVIIIIFIMALLVCLIMYALRLSYATIIAVILAIAYVLLAIKMFDYGIVANIIYPVLAVVVVYVGLVILHYFAEKRSRKWVTEIFGKYVSKDVADEILASGKGALKLKGNRRYITILFADIRGFTSVSEKLNPEQVVNMLNHYLGEMTDIIFEHKGTVDKYIGDAIMALFNAPVMQEDHALRAVRTALHMQQAAKNLSKNAPTPVRYGIGVNTGYAIVGNMGSEKRMDYTAIGDSVNLASRLCGKAGPDEVFIGEETYRLVKGKVSAQKVGKMEVKGKKKKVMVYAVESVLE